MGLVRSRDGSSVRRSWCGGGRSRDNADEATPAGRAPRVRCVPWSRAWWKAILGMAPPLWPLLRGCCGDARGECTTNIVGIGSLCTSQCQVFNQLSARYPALNGCGAAPHSEDKLACSEKGHHAPTTIQFKLTIPFSKMDGATLRTLELQRRSVGWVWSQPVMCRPRARDCSASVIYLLQQQNNKRWHTT